MTEHRPIGGDWWLWRDFAVRSAGFAVSGLGAFGGGDESSRLREVAGDPAFREAVTWQNPAALSNAVDKIAAGPSSRASVQRRREETVASYWQRYCAKNDTIGFFGPLAWGSIVDAGPALASHSGELIRERSVHLEAWGVQALAEVIDPALEVPTGARAEDDLRDVLEAHADTETRERGLGMLARLLAARDGVAGADREGLAAALDDLDRVFIELTGRAATRNAGRAYGARTLAYVDCLRDLDVTIGPGLVADVAPALRLVFEAGRWYSGQVQSVARDVIGAALPEGGQGPFGPVLGQVMGALMSLPPALDAEVTELQRRVSKLLADPDPDPATLGDRAAAAFADAAPAWPTAVYQSADLQIAARDVAAVEGGEYLAVLGDTHPGDNPLGQALFGLRFPDPARYFAQTAAEAGSPLVLLLPPWGPGMGVDARGVPLTAAQDILIAPDPATHAPAGRRTWRVGELAVDGWDVVDRSGTLRVPVLEVFSLPTFVSGVRTFELYPETTHMPRITVGRTVLRRETWNVPAAEIPSAAELRAWGAELGMPRRVFAKSPVERKPIYLDLDSPALTRIASRQVRQAAEVDPAAVMRFTEMLPTPDQCWLADPDGGRYAAELRFVGVAQPSENRMGAAGFEPATSRV